MAAIVRIVDGLQGATLLDLNLLSAGAVLGRGQYTWGDVQIVDGPTGGDGVREWVSTSAPADVTSRRIQQPFILVGTSVDDVGTKVSTLMTLTRTPFWIETRRHGATNSTWLRCFPTVPKVEHRHLANGLGNIAVGVIECDADPYAYGPRVTVPGSVGQDPAVAGAFVLDVNGVGGDSLTPAIIHSSDTDLVGQAGATTLIAVRRRGVPANLSSFIRQGEAEDSSANTGANVTQADVADANASGGNSRRITFAAGFVNDGLNYAQINFDPAFTAGLEVPGTYRLVARFTRGGGGAGIEHRILPFYGNFGPTVYRYRAGGADTRVIDLGLYQTPLAQPVTPMSPAAALGASWQRLALLIWKSGAAGAGTFDLDWIAAIPADEDMGRLYQVGAAPAGATVVLDGFANMQRWTSGDPFNPASVETGQPTAVTECGYFGGVPRLRPGNNRLFIVGGMSSTVLLPKTATFDVTVSYWPRYTWVR